VLAEKARAEVRGDSVLVGAAQGAAAGTLGSVYALARGNAVSEQSLSQHNSSEDSREALLIGALLGSFVAIGAIVAGGAALADNVSTRDAAYADAMDACLRPAVLTLELGPEHPEVARSLRSLGYRYYRQGELAKAEPLYVRALAIQEQALGADNPEVAGFLDDYAALLGRTGREVEAEKLKERARAIRVKR
jgi:tetratricopeptide (TPR) repeat protein